MPDLLTAAEAAAYLRCSLATVRAWTSRKKMPVVRLGHLARYRKSDLDAFIESKLVVAEGGRHEGHA